MPLLDFDLHVVPARWRSVLRPGRLYHFSAVMKCPDIAVVTWP